MFQITEYGKPDGLPLIYCHGSPGSRLEGKLLDTQCKSKGVRLIAYNRRGFGRNPINKTQTIVSEASDVIEVADSLGLEKFALVGMSGGGATALGVASLYPQRLTFVASLGGWAPILELEALQDELSPIDRFFFKISGVFPVLFRLAFSYIGYRVKKNQESLVKLLNSSLNQTDKTYLQENPDTLEIVFEGQKEAFASGAHGPALDAQVRYKPWGFSFYDISIPIHYYAGDDDRLVPLSFARAAANATPESRLTIFPNTGHFGLFKHFSQIITDLKVEIAK